MISDAVWEFRVGPAIMSLPNMKRDHGSDFMCEPDGEGSTYVKFMSDHGVNDDHNGMVLADYLRANGATVMQSRARSMIVLDADIERIFLKDSK